MFQVSAAHAQAALLPAASLPATSLPDLTVPPHGWVGAAALGTGAVLALIALVRRGRATLLRRRRLRGGPAHR